MAEGKIVPLFERTHDGVSDDVVHRLRGLLRDALAPAGGPRLVGIAYVCMYADDQHAVDSVGATSDSPIFSRGLLRELDDLLSTLARANRLGGGT